MTETKNCPKCSGFIPNNETPGAYSGAISRRDNSTEICSACGTQEALEDFFGTAVK
jgi:RNA polymerase subunit RPABC4/transcription elongation factor Spt4